MGRASRRKRVLRGAASEAKLSERLIELIAPLREPGMEHDEYDGLLKFAAVAWNLSLLPEDKRREAMDRALVDFPQLRAFQADLEASIDRKAALFPDDRRLIADVYVTDLGDGRLNVIVASERV